MKIDHHPDDATLMSYASGSLPEALAAVVAAHIERCPHCASAVRDMELIGAALFENIEGEPVRPAQTPSPSTVNPSADLAPNRANETSSVLSRIIGDDLDDIHWKRLGFGIWHYPLKLSPGAEGDLRLIKVAPGQVLPEHGHGGSELTLILKGSYSDEFGTYTEGDLSDLGDDVDHRPISDPTEGCICLIASEKKARFKDVVSRIVQPLTGL